MVHEASHDDLRECLQELLASYTSVMSYCAWQGLDVSEMEVIIQRVRATLEQL